jgi:hypothetical protein
METPSKRYKLNKTDGLKIAKGACIAVGGALCTYLLQVITQVDFGQYTEITVALGGILINSLYKWIRTE